MDFAAAERAYWDMITEGIPAPVEALRMVVDTMKAQFALGSRPVLAGRPTVTESERVEGRLRRFRRLAAHAAKETVYYAEVFAQAGLDPETLTWEDIALLPITPKAHLRDQLADFVAADCIPMFLSYTGGTTGGRPIGLWWSDREFELTALATNIAAMSEPDLDEDICLFTGDSTQFLSMTVNGRGNVIFGDPTVWGRMHSPDATLDQLMTVHRRGTRRMRPTMMIAFPSYLGSLVEARRSRSLDAADFDLRFVSLGGEVATRGLRRRFKEVFGDLPIFDVYGSSELWGSGNAFGCPEGHMHFGANCHWEFLDVDSGAPAAPGAVATLVASVLPPLRETTLLLRYDTEDLFRMPLLPPTCGGRLPFAGPMLGRRSLSLRHQDGSWTFPRQILEAVEDVDELPLPARCGFWAHQDGVAVEVVAAGVAARTAGASATAATVRARLGDNLEREGVRLTALHLREGREALEHPYPLRCDGR